MDEAALNEHDYVLLDHLRSAPGEWYVVHTFAGHERRAATNIRASVMNNDLEHVVHQIEVPTEMVWEVRGNERKKVERVKLPGYVLIRMDMDNPLAWHVIASTQGVTRFVGHAGTPVPISTDEAFQMLRTSTPAVAAATAPEPVRSDYYVGDPVRVTSGPFESLSATVSDLNTAVRRVTVVVELFGRETPVELNFDQIEPL